MIGRKKEWLDVGILALIGLALVLFGLHRIISYDVWWQIGAGEWILGNGFPTFDPFNYVASDLPWVEMRWLYSVFIYLVYQGLGLNALIGVKLLFLGLTFLLLGLVYRGVHRWVVMLGLVMTLAIAHNRFFVRPELVTYLLLTLFLFCLYRFRQNGNWRWLAALPLVQVVWVNAHTLFVLGPVILWLFGLVEWLGPKLVGDYLPVESKRLSFGQLRPVFGAAVGVTLACLVNPYGIDGALFPLELFREINNTHAFSNLISEFLSPFAYAGFNVPFVGYLIGIGISILSFGLNYRRLSLSSLVIWGAFLYLSLLAVRNVALFGFVAGFFTIQQVGQWADAQEGPDFLRRLGPGLARLLAAGFVLVMMPLIVTNAYYRSNDKAFGFGVAEDRFPIQAMQFIRQEGLPGPILHNLGDGGYLIFEGGAESVFVDGRLEVYGGEYVERAIRLFQTGEGLNEVVNANNIQTILVKHYTDQGMLFALEADASWRPVYYDSQNVVYLREGEETAELVNRLAFDWQAPPVFEEMEPPEWLPPPYLANLFPSVVSNREQLVLGELFLYAGNLDRALAYFDEAIEIGPVNETVHFYRGVIFRAMGDEGRAADIFLALDENFLNQAGAQLFAGRIYAKVDNNRAALNSYQKGIELGGATDGNYRELIRLALLEKDYPVAISALVELAQIRPQDAGIWNELGLIYVEIGDLQRAQRAFEQALAVDPTYEAARENLDRLAGNN